MFVTYTAKYVGAELPKAWKGCVSYKAGNIIAFMDNLMNNILYRGRYDELSAHVANGLNANKAFQTIPPRDLVNCDTFLTIDRILIKWIVERLLAEDMGAALDGLTLPQVCEKRSKMHFGERKLGSAIGCSAAHTRLFRPEITTAGTASKTFFASIRKRISVLTGNTAGSTPPVTRSRTRRALSLCATWWRISIPTNIWKPLLPKWNAAIQEPDAFVALPCSGISMLAI